MFGGGGKRNSSFLYGLCTFYLIKLVWARGMDYKPNIGLEFTTS
jgi:hypothetical protein